MSRAFVKEDDVSSLGELPERPLGDERNFVTPRGLERIDAELERLSRELSVAEADAKPRLARDLRYWSARRETAEVIASPPDDGRVHFGGRVTLAYEGESQRCYRIVGIDEADPQAELLSHASPLAQALLGRKVGELVTVAGREAEILGIAV